MFCPNCGRDNSRERKFCASCGTNLEIVSQALNGNRDDFFTKTDASLDQLIARYSEHVFKDASSKLHERAVGNSWKILGQGIVTTFVDMVLFSLMWNIIPLRFLILMVSTPFRLLSRRKSVQAAAELDEHKKPAIAQPSSNKWLPGSVPSVSEHTTQNLEEYHPPERQKVARRD
ncbi:MAG: zinc ribbon domain-containing protein [Blastocatellia bacterium]